MELWYLQIFFLVFFFHSKIVPQIVMFFSSSNYIIAYEKIFFVGCSSIVNFALTYSNVRFEIPFSVMFIHNIVHVWVQTQKKTEKWK